MHPCGDCYQYHACFMKKIWKLFSFSYALKQFAHYNDLFLKDLGEFLLKLSGSGVFWRAALRLPPFPL